MHIHVDSLVQTRRVTRLSGLHVCVKRSLTERFRLEVPSPFAASHPRGHSDPSTATPSLGLTFRSHLTSFSKYKQNVLKSTNYKGKLVLALNLSSIAPLKHIWGCGRIALPFLNSALDGDEWSASRTGRFNPRGERTRYPLDKRLSGSRSRSERCGEEENLLSLAGIEPRQSSL
jgi:hypothetical protein